MLERRISGTATERYGELPPPSAELDIIAALTDSLLEILPKKDRKRFLSLVEVKLAQHEALAKVTRIRPPEQDEAKATARAQAFAWMRMAKDVLEAVDRSKGRR